MRRFILLFVSILLIIGLCIPVSAANYASKIEVSAVVGSDKSCQVTVHATLHITENTGSLTYPIPLDATNVTLENTRVRTQKTQQAQLVDLTDAVGSMTGDLSVTIRYELPNVIHTDAAGNPQLQLPILSGFKSPISQLDYKITLPGEINAKPAFSSGYHHADIEKDLSSTVNGNAITGYSVTELKDHETLTMYLPVQEAWFPDAPLHFLESNADDIAMLICGLAALLYWIFFLRFFPAIPTSTPNPPEGITAGQLRRVLTLGPADLSLMVLSWAQLGYVQLQAGNRRVRVQKIMDMGNERSDFEQRIFKKLFAKKDIVDTSGLPYANLSVQVRKLRQDSQALVQRNSGNTTLFRALCALICLFGGISFGIAMTQQAVVQGIWVFLTAVAGLVCGFFMQAPIGELFLKKTRATAYGLICAVVWLLLGIFAGQIGLAILLFIVQCLAGWMCFYGGKRTESGKQELSRILGLRKYLKTISRETLTRNMELDPDYFHTMLPYAIALGIGHQFARRFEKQKISPCPYIVCRTHNLHFASHWSAKVQSILSSMDRRSRKLPMERVTALLAAAKNISKQETE